MREGYEGLVLGNVEPKHGLDPVDTPTHPNVPTHPDHRSILQNLQFGDGELLWEGDADADAEDNTGRSLKGRHIIRVGWDDVRGWLSEVSISSSWYRGHVLSDNSLGRHIDRNCQIKSLSYTGRSIRCRAQPN